MLHHSILLRRNPSFTFDNYWVGNNFFKNQWMHSDLKEDEQAFYISVDVPGAKKEQVQVSVENGYLSVEVTQEESKEESQGEKTEEEQSSTFLGAKHLHPRTQRTGHKVFQIGKTVDEENIEAQLQDGVLYLRLFKKQPQQSKRIIDLQ